MNPDGRVNVQSLADDLHFYREQGLIKGDVKLDELVDHSFVDAVVKELGPYPAVDGVISAKVRNEGVERRAGA